MEPPSGQSHGPRCRCPGGGPPQPPEVLCATKARAFREGCALTLQHPVAELLLRGNARPLSALS
eukprot:7192406-Alexandrium_andersonii.AAC.1